MAEIDYLFRLSTPGRAPADMIDEVEDVLQDSLERIGRRFGRRDIRPAADEERRRRGRVWRRKRGVSVSATGRVVVESRIPTEERIGDAVLTGECFETVALFTHRPDCVCLMVDQHGRSGGRHALARLTAEQARTLAAALVEVSAELERSRS